jgi:hypothetical protein
MEIVKIERNLEFLEQNKTVRDSSLDIQECIGQWGLDENAFLSTCPLFCSESWGTCSLPLGF